MIYSSTYIFFTVFFPVFLTLIFSLSNCCCLCRLLHLNFSQFFLLVVNLICSMHNLQVLFLLLASLTALIGRGLWYLFICSSNILSSFVLKLHILHWFFLLFLIFPSLSVGFFPIISYAAFPDTFMYSRAIFAASSADCNLVTICSNSSLLICVFFLCYSFCEYPHTFLDFFYISCSFLHVVIAYTFTPLHSLVFFWPQINT